MGAARGRDRHHIPAGFDVATLAIAVGVVLALIVGGQGRPDGAVASPPPADRVAHGAAGTARNGFGGEIARSPSMPSWPGTGNGGNGGPFAFIGAQYGTLWNIPPRPNNSLGVGYCVMEDVGGTGAVTVRPLPSVWDDTERARAAALMATFGGDRVVPYGIDASGAYDVGTGEWHEPTLFGGGEYTRRRHVAVGFGVKMFLEDVSPSGAPAGRKLATDAAVVRGTGGEFNALSAGYRMAVRMAAIAERQHAVGELRLDLRWVVPDGGPPTKPGTYAVEITVTDAGGKPVGMVPVVQLSSVGIGRARSVGTTVEVITTGDTPDDFTRRAAAAATGWPTWDMGTRMTSDRRFAVGAHPGAADVTSPDGVARFTVTLDDRRSWELAFRAIAPTADVALYAGTGIQGQVTWVGSERSTLVHLTLGPPSPPPTTTTTTTTLPPTTTSPPTTSSTTTTTTTTTSSSTTSTTSTTTSTAPPTTTASPPASTTTAPASAPLAPTTTPQPSTSTTTPPTAPTTLPPTTSVPMTSPTATLPRTGGEANEMQRRLADAAVGMFLVGTALVIGTRLTRR